jgi:acetyltransferase
MTSHPGAVVSSFIRPRHVALVGASQRKESISARPARYLRELEFPGDVTIVNPSAVGPIDGFPVVRSVEALPETVDLAMVLVSARDVLTSVAACVAVGIERVCDKSSLIFWVNTPTFEWWARTATAS